MIKTPISIAAAEMTNIVYLNTSDAFILSP